MGAGAGVGGGGRDDLRVSVTIKKPVEWRTI